MEVAGHYVLAVDQSTQGTKAVVFDGRGLVRAKASLNHRQIVNARGWVEHDPEEIIRNVYSVCRDALMQARVKTSELVGVGLSNQRETVVAWDRKTGKPLYNAIVWQCSRAKEIVLELDPAAKRIREVTGLTLSPFFSAAKMTWLLRNVNAVHKANELGTLALGTVDSWLIYKLCEGHPFLTEPSNACRTQLFDLAKLCWSDEMCAVFGVPHQALAELRPSNSIFGLTTLGGYLNVPVPVCGVLGDSQAALMGQGCVDPGDVKATYGTGSSVMMQVGTALPATYEGLISSIGWQLDEEACYVLEANLNYTGAIISWLKDQVGLINDPAECGTYARAANPDDRCVFVPAFTGLGAPWWDNDATAMWTGITRTTGKNELVKAGLDSIAFQIADVIDLTRKATGRPISELRVDGGPAGNDYLMQLQADLAQVRINVSGLKELSAGGVAYLAGRTAKLYSENAIFAAMERRVFERRMPDAKRVELTSRWHKALHQVLSHSPEEEMG